MDGNGRWAQHRGLERTQGHMAALPALDAVVEGALEEKVEWLTLFAFSTENWFRPEEEVSFLVDFFVRHVVGRKAQRMHERGLRLRLMGHEDARIPADVMDKLRAAEELTRDNSTLQVVLAFNYGGRQDLCESARSLATQSVPPGDITPEIFAQHLRLPQLPDVDVLLRTGGEHRLSNFLLWHCAYAELIFLDVLWPDFRTSHFRHAMELYHQRQRRFGALGPAAAADAAASAAATGHPLAPGLASLPGPSALLGLPTAIVSHLGASVWDGLKDTARFALQQLAAESVPHGDPGRTE